MELTYSENYFTLLIGLIKSDLNSKVRSSSMWEYIFGLPFNSAKNKI